MGLTCYTAKKLPCERLDMLTWEWGEVVLLEEIIYTHAEKFGDQTDMVAVIEPCEQVDAFATEGGMRQLVC